MSNIANERAGTETAKLNDYLVFINCILSKWNIDILFPATIDEYYVSISCE